MRNLGLRNRIGLLALGTASTVLVLVACTGGPGPLPDPNQQNPNVEEEGSGQQGTSTTVTTNPVGSASSGTTSGSSSGVSTTSSSSSSSSGASQTQTITTNEFNTSCQVDSDCVLVFTGLVCQSCQCPNSAIAASDQGNYSSQLSQRSASCQPQNGADCPACSNTFVATCSPNNKCALGLPKKDAG